MAYSQDFLKTCVDRNEDYKQVKKFAACGYLQSNYIYTLKSGITLLV